LGRCPVRRQRSSRPYYSGDKVTKFFALLRMPAQEMRLKVRPSREGVRLDLGDRFTFLGPRLATDLANALIDCLETKETPCSTPPADCSPSTSQPSNPATTPSDSSKTTSTTSTGTK